MYYKRIEENEEKFDTIINIKQFSKSKRRINQNLFKKW